MANMRTARLLLPLQFVGLSMASRCEDLNLPQNQVDTSDPSAKFGHPGKRLSACSTSSVSIAITGY